LFFVGPQKNGLQSEKIFEVFGKKVFVHHDEHSIGEIV
jgi:hypothetical protein